MEPPTIINPHLGRVDAFAAKTLSAQIGDIVAPLLATITALIVAGVALNTAIPGSAGIYIIAVTAAIAIAKIRSSRPARTVTLYGLGYVTSQMQRLSMDRYNREAQPHVDALARAATVASHIADTARAAAANTMLASSTAAAAAAADTLLWRIAVHRRGAIDELPTMGSYDYDACYQRSAEHAASADQLTDELDQLAAAVDRTVAAAVGPVPDTDDTDDLVAISAAQLAAGELALTAASYDALHPVRNAEALIAQTSTS